MKNIIFITSLLISSNSFASFYAKCDYNAKIIGLKPLATLNVPVQGQYNGKDNYFYKLELMLTDGVVGPGSHVQTCEKRMLEVLVKKKDNYKVGQKLKITITEANSRGGGFSYSVSTK